MRDMELQKELDTLRDAPFAKKTDAQLLAIENLSGRKLTDEHRKKISQSNKGRILTEETRKKIGQANKNARAEISKKMTGRKLSVKTRKKMSNAQKNKSFEHRKKISKSLTGRQQSSDTRKKCAQNNSKISFSIANKIRKEYADWILKHGKSGSHIHFAKKYNVSRPTISMIVNNKIWKEEY